MNAERFPISPKLLCHGLVYFPRMLDKIRLHSAGQLPAAYHENLGQGMDSWICQFLHIEYETVRALVADGASDDSIFKHCCSQGRRPNAFEIQMFNEFLAKRGFRDGMTERLAMRKQEAGWSARDDIQTFFDYIECDELRQ